MVDSIRLLKFLDRIPVFVIKLGTRGRACWTERVAFTLITVFVVIFMINEVNQSEINDIHSFILVVKNIFVIVPVSCWIWYIWFKDQEEKVSIQDVSNFDYKFQNRCTASDGFYVGLAVLLQLSTWGTFCFQTIYTFRLSTYTLYKYVTSAVMFGCTFQVLMMKHLLNKRLKAVTTCVEEGEYPLSIVFMIQELIDLSIRVNRFFSYIVTCCLVFNLIAGMRNVAGLWMLFHLLEEAHEIAIGISLGLYNLQLLWVVLECSSTSSLIYDLQWEVDRVISNRRSPLNRTKQLMVFLQELNHSPTVFTCLDLFTAEPSSVTILCSLMLNALMVFIQFMRKEL